MFTFICILFVFVSIFYTNYTRINRKNEQKVKQIGKALKNTFKASQGSDSRNKERKFTGFFFLYVYYVDYKSGKFKGPSKFCSFVTLLCFQSTTENSECHNSSADLERSVNSVVDAVHVTVA